MTNQNGSETNTIIIRCADLLGLLFALEIDIQAPQYDQSYEPGPYMQEPGPSSAAPSALHADTSDKGRGRKRARIQVCVNISVLYTLCL